ncbi:MAG: type II secretion system F family protein [Planctomycetes bacterium]|nr:type II secretion system F family protein [Planctomycetota bacterium]
MPTYKYAAKTNDGKTIRGTLVAAAPSEVVGELRRKSLVVLDVKETSRAASAAAAVGGGRFAAKPGKARKDELVIFTRQLSTMISAGIPLLESLDVLAGQVDNPRFAKTLKMVADDVRGGSDFSTALTRYPKAFVPIYCSMVRAGEVSGQLDEILVRLAEYQESSARLKREIKAAMTYPVISLCMVLGITMFLLIGIVPQFKPIFVSLQIDLPALTATVLGCSEWLVANWMVAIGIGAAACFGIALFKRTEAGGCTVDWCVLKMPVFGPLFRKVALSRFARTFSTLLRSGVPILGALEIVADTAGNRVVSRAVLNARDSVRNGNSLSEPLDKSPVFPAMVTRMIAIGEKSGSLEQLLEKISVFYDEQVSAAVKSLTSMIEPLLIGLMGGLVGTIVFAVFLPIFEIQKKLAGGG